jgi:hypothetical protein
MLEIYKFSDNFLKAVARRENQDKITSNLGKN